MEPVKWADQEVVVARGVEVKPGTIILYTWEGTPEAYQLDDRKLTRTR
jgi:hypothetical protein